MIAKLDINDFKTPSARATQQGNSMTRTLSTINKINEIIDAFGTVATAATISAINLQLTAVVASQDACLMQLNGLANRVKALEKPPQAAIPNVSETPVLVSVGNLVNIGDMSANGTAQAKTINKVLAVLRVRGEINP